MRLIDADELINDIQYNLWDWKSVDGITATTVLKQTITDIKNEPTIDAVPVVRCKDCRYWKDQAEGVVEVPVCEYDCRNGKIGITQIMGAEDYCSHGERREDERVHM